MAPAGLARVGADSCAPSSLPFMFPYLGRKCRKEATGAATDRPHQPRASRLTEGASRPGIPSRFFRPLQSKTVTRREAARTCPDFPISQLCTRLSQGRNTACGLARGCGPLGKVEGRGPAPLAPAHWCGWEHRRAATAGRGYDRSRDLPSATRGRVLNTVPGESQTHRPHRVTTFLGHVHSRQIHRQSVGPWVPGAGEGGGDGSQGCSGGWSEVMIHSIENVLNARDCSLKNG